MPALLELILERNFERAYGLLRDYQERNLLPRGFAGWAWYHLLKRA